MRIGVAGSMHFTEQMVQVCDDLKTLGHDPFMSKFAPFFMDKTDAQKEQIKLDQKAKHDVIREFWEPMQTADALLVVNFDRNGIDNYIGGNAFLEMGFAHVLKQKIFLLNPIPEIPFYKSEIVSMKPLVLNGDLSKIK